MPKYEVMLIRKVEVYTTVEVEADDEDAAGRKAKIIIAEDEDTLLGDWEIDWSRAGAPEVEMVDEM